MLVSTFDILGLLNNVNKKANIDNTEAMIINAITTMITSKTKPIYVKVKS